MIGNILLGQGIIFQKLNNPQKAIEYYQKAISEYEEVEHEIGISSCYNNIAALYNSMDLFDKSKAIIKIELRKSIERKDTNRISSLYSNLAYSFHGLGEFDSSLFYVEKAIDLAESSNDIYAIHTGCQTKRAAYHESGNLDSAIVNYRRAINYFLEQGNTHDLNWAYVALGQAYIDKGSYQHAILLLDSASLNSKHLDDSYTLMKEISKMKALAFSAINMKDSALHYFESALTYTDSINKRDVESVLMNFEITALTNKLQIELDESQKAKLELESANSRQRSWLMGILIVRILPSGHCFTSPIENT